MKDIIMGTRYTFFTLFAAFAVLGSGCSQQTINSASKDVSHNIQAANREVSKLGAQAKPQLNKLDLGARVTAALRANANLPRTIRVDASVTGVRLRGAVHNADQKALAGKVARET